MKLFSKGKDGGQYSTVTGYWLVEIKSLFSIVLLHFSDGSRDAFHTHAFNTISWILKGDTTEYLISGETYKNKASIFPIYTSRSRFHKVVSRGDTWVLSFRGPWINTWKEFLCGSKRFVTLTNGRKEVEAS